VDDIQPLSFLNATNLADTIQGFLDRQALGFTSATGQGLRPYALRHQACFTCYQYGALCANPSAARRDA
jgi:hypothetical protein